MHILFVYQRASSFVKTDLVLLRERYDVAELHQRSKAVNIFRICQQVRAHDLVFCWFASWHSFFPVLFARLLNKPSIVVVGGYDVAPSLGIGYGHQSGGYRQWVTNATIGLATHLVTHSEHSRIEAMTQVGVAPAKITVVYCGLDASHFTFCESKEPLVITVGDVAQDNIWRKGTLPFVRAAAALPELPFVVIGDWQDDAIDLLRTEASANVRFTGWVSDEELLTWFQRASVYVQASLYEGFGVAVAEAMLCGCIPVVTRVAALPEVIGDAGVYVSSQEPQALAEGVSRALMLDQSWRVRARERVARKFPLSQRASVLYDVIQRVSGMDSESLP